MSTSDKYLIEYGAATFVTWSDFGVKNQAIDSDAVYFNR